MSEHQDQERTEQATPKRIKQSRDDGNVARSRDLNTTLLLLSGSISFLVFGKSIVANMSAIMKLGVSTSFLDISNENLMLERLQQVSYLALSVLSPILIILLLAAIIAPISLSGFVFSAKAIKPKMDRLNVMKGIKRIFSGKSVLELLKSLLKFAVIFSITIWILWGSLDEIVALQSYSIEFAMLAAVKIVAWSFFYICSTLIVISAVDVPFQLWQHAKELKMSKQEIKDEHRESEGNPQIKSQIRRAQQELSRKRMMDEVPKADVIITNPTHYSVAIRYEQQKMSAPRVVAKGADVMALKIQAVAKEHGVTIVNTPPLARAIFYSTKLNHEVPHGLYVAVAQVLAYVYQLKRYQKGAGVRPRELNDLTIPDDLKR